PVPRRLRDVFPNHLAVGPDPSLRKLRSVAAIAPPEFRSRRRGRRSRKLGDVESAVRTGGPDRDGDQPRAGPRGRGRIKGLYAVEHEAKDLDAPARAAGRQTKARPLLDALKHWLDRERAQVVPKTPIAEAIHYALNQWTALTVYLTDGELAIDNNAAERAIKPF